MWYLDESKIDRDKKIAKEKRQRILLTVLSVLFFITTLVAISAAIAAYASAEQAKLNEQRAKQNSEFARLKEQEARDFSQKLSVSEKETRSVNESLQITNEKLKKSEDSLRDKNEELQDSLENAQEQKRIAQNEKERADKEARQAKLSEAAAQKALEEQNRLRIVAENKQKELETALDEINATVARGEINRSGLVFIEQEEFKRALPEFQKLLARYENENEPMNTESRNDGKWWTLHNLGIVYSNLPEDFQSRDNFTDSECSYKKALNILHDKLTLLNISGEKFDVSQCPPEQTAQMQNTVPDIKPVEEINRSQVTTLRRLARLYHQEAVAVENYNKILAILPKEYNFQKEETYPAALYVELADTLSDLNGWENYDKITELYEKSAKTYQDEREFANQIEVLKKWSDFAIRHDRSLVAIDKLKELAEIQENKLNLSPFDREIADSYNTIDKAYRANAMPNDAYGELSKMIVDLDYKANKTNSFLVGMKEIEELANAYIKIGKCRRAEKVFLIADDFWKADPIYPDFLITLGQFYRNVQKDNKNAEIYFDKFVEKGKKIDTVKSEIIRRKNLRNPVSYNEIKDQPEAWTTAGDFYFEIKNYDKAKEAYEQALGFIIFLNENFSESAVNPDVPYPVQKAETTVKIALVYEAQNKTEEAKAAYSEAVGMVPDISAIEKRYAKEVSETPVSDRGTVSYSRLIFLWLKILVGQADFDERHGERQKAQEIYKKAEVISRGLKGLTRSEQMVLNAQINKKLGDMNRADVKIADSYYARAIFSIARLTSCSKNEKSQYCINGELNAKYYSYKAEIYESKISLNSVENSNELKTAAQEARKKADELKIEEQKSICEQNN
jgi:tetratricopeptide (TPR) repeat protein